MEFFMQELMGDNFSTIISRLLVALVLSGLIGFEREWNNHSAGFRTHILVGVGSSLMMLLSLYGFLDFIEAYDNVRFDPARIPSYVISGIGFLGAGTIIVYGGAIRGLTTAASIWAVAGVGLVVGAGMIGPAIITTIIILFSLVLLNRLEKLFQPKKNSVTIEVVVGQDLEIHRLLRAIEAHHVTVSNVEVEKSQTQLRTIYIKMNAIDNKDLITLFEGISKLESVKQVSRLAR